MMLLLSRKKIPVIAKKLTVTWEGKLLCVETGVSAQPKVKGNFPVDILQIVF